MSHPPDVPRPGAEGPSELADRVRAWRGDARVGAVVLACVALAAGVAWFRAGIAPSAPSAAAASSGSRTSSQTTSYPAAFATTLPAVTTSTGVSAIVIDVVGAVRSPGVVSLSAGARVIDAIRAAGGAKATADLSRLNLAAKLDDGARVAVPLFGQPPPAVDPGAVSGTAGGTTDPAGGAPAAAGTPIDVNTATVEQLETLPGIGPTLAGAIVQERVRNGPFRSVDDLNRVPGIGDGRLAQLRDLVTVG
jgi:competence protein ComEA